MTNEHVHTYNPCVQLLSDPPQYRCCGCGALVMCHEAEKRGWVAVESSKYRIAYDDGVPSKEEYELLRSRMFYTSMELWRCRRSLANMNRRAQAAESWMSTENKTMRSLMKRAEAERRRADDWKRKYKHERSKKMATLLDMIVNTFAWGSR